MEYYNNFICLYPNGIKNNEYIIENVQKLIEKKKTNFDISIWFSKRMVNQLVRDYIKYIEDIESNHNNSNFYLMFENIKNIQMLKNIENKDLKQYVLNSRTSNFIEFGNYYNLIYFYINFNNGKIIVYDYSDNKLFIYNNFKLFYNALLLFQNNEYIDKYFEKINKKISFEPNNYNFLIKEGIIDLI